MIDLEKLTQGELLALIANATAVLQRRLHTPGFVAEKEEPKTLVLSPGSHEQALVNACISRMRNGKPVLAAERREYKELYSKYSEWFRHNRFPPDTTGADAKGWLRVYGKGQ